MRTVGINADGADFAVPGGQAKFGALLERLRPAHDRSLAAMGAMVHHLDVYGMPVTDARVVETALRGAEGRARSDDARLAEAMRGFVRSRSAYAQAKAA